jgi:hypothetical protein
MAATATFTCVCGVQKKTTNHWVLAKVTSDSIQFLPWDWELALTDDIIILCGEGCAAALLSRSLGEWKALPPNVGTMSANVFQQHQQH